MRGEQYDWEEQNMGNPQEWALYRRKPRKVAVPRFPLIWKQCPTLVSRLVCEGMELRTELRHSSWASGI